MTTPTSKTIMLDTPIKRGQQTINEVTVRKPNAGELRGLSLSSLLTLDVNELGKLLPRITTPILHEPDIQQLDPADLVELGTGAISFFVKKDKQEALSPTA
ncbi:phage tail assembly protein [Agitococcus lubricus]|uniref:Tail assembly chaperone E/41/14-like protein n=1 Tax=Agitococcus lubricus TaxID=1077255 RepID=A0A2T5J1F7_9GAMM|nr:phage tail assembly protein [Agitococcus lubricus]PTQ90274.1 tail assembly chaperone E/41/14-like protein [Agitococcus lubricus]